MCVGHVTLSECLKLQMVDLVHGVVPGSLLTRVPSRVTPSPQTATEQPVRFAGINRPQPEELKE